MDHGLRSTGKEWTYFVCLVKLLTNWVLGLSSSAFLNFLSGWTWTCPFSWRTWFFVPLPKSTSKPQLWLSFTTRYNVELWFWPRVTTRSRSKRTYRWWVGAVGRGVLRNILHSLSLSQDFLWIKTSYQFFPMHECVVCVPGDFLLLMWQQERRHGRRVFRLDRKQRF